MAKKTRLTPQQEVVVLRQEVRRLRLQGFLNNFAKVAVAAIQWSALFGIAYWIHLTLISWSGKSTTADVKIGATGSFSLGSCELTALFAILFGVLGVFYAQRERALRRSVVARLHPYQLEHEKNLDPKRTSSRLTPSGDTRPEDM